jgi:hypothetical protein
MTNIFAGSECFSSYLNGVKIFPYFIPSSPPNNLRPLLVRRETEKEKMTENT